MFVYVVIKDCCSTSDILGIFQEEDAAVAFARKQVVAGYMHIEKWAVQ